MDNDSEMSSYRGEVIEALAEAQEPLSQEELINAVLEPQEPKILREVLKEEPETMRERAKLFLSYAEAHEEQICEAVEYHLDRENIHITKEWDFALKEEIAQTY